MARYLINLKSGIFHDRHYSTERCNLDAAHITGMTVSTWRETETFIGQEARNYEYCRWCAKQERYERGAVQS